VNGALPLDGTIFLFLPNRPALSPVFFCKVGSQMTTCSHPHFSREWRVHAYGFRDGKSLPFLHGRFCGEDPQISGFGLWLFRRFFNELPDVPPPLESTR